MRPMRLKGNDPIGNIYIYIFVYIYIYLGCGPLTVTVTTRIITFLVGDSYKTFISHCYWEGAISMGIQGEPLRSQTMDPSAVRVRVPKVFTPMILTRKVEGEHQVGPRSSLEGSHPYIPWTAQCLGWPLLRGLGCGFGSWNGKDVSVILFVFFEDVFFLVGWCLIQKQQQKDSMSTPE